MPKMPNVQVYSRLEVLGVVKKEEGGNWCWPGGGGGGDACGGRGGLLRPRFHCWHVFHLLIMLHDVMHGVETWHVHREQEASVRCCY